MVRGSLTGDLRDVAITWALLAAALVAFVGPDVFDLHAMQPYAGDALSHAFLVKTILETGWFSHSDVVGAPFGTDFLDYPFADSLHFLMIGAIGLVGRDWIVTSNLFFLASFFLAAASACVVLRRLGLASPWAIAGGVLFALLPYHLMRRRHLLLASYFAVPLGVYLAVVAAGAAERRDMPRPRASTVGVLAILVGCTGIYYALFSAFLVAVSGLVAIVAARRIAAGRVAMAIVLAVGLVLLANAAPTIAYRMAHGPNPEAVVRNPAESEIHGLRITQMLMPHPDHRIEAAASLAVRYATSAPLVGENQYAALGLVGSAGFVLLMIVALARVAGAPVGRAPVPLLAALALAGLLLGTIGGIGAWLAYTVTPTLRAYNRISIFIGFISLAAALLLLQAWLSRTRAGARPAVAALIAGLVTVIGVLDQTPARHASGSAATFASDRAFVRELEARLPAGTAVLQLPYQAYPEGGSVWTMGQYDPLRGALHSTSLRWSYAAMRGREPDVWIRALVANAPERMLDLAAQSGFGAVYVDRRGYADRGAAIETALRASLGPPIAASADGQLVAYALARKGDAPLPIARLASVEASVALDQPALPGAVTGVAGFAAREGWGRWTEGPVARVDYALPLPRKFVLVIDVAHVTPANADRDIVVKAGTATARFRLPPTGGRVEVPLDTDGTARSVEIHVPEPTSPHRLGWSEDRRPLGIGIKSLAVVPARS